jgi:hypothetical protein
MMRAFPSLKVLIVDQSISEILQEQVRDETSRELFGLMDYSRVRNLQLLVPLVMNSGPIIAIDDDEVIRDAAFLDKATASLGNEIDGKTVAGLSGYYEGADGGIMLDEPPGSHSASSIFDRKAVIMNEATRQLEDEAARIVPTPFCFGGNMIFSPELAASVAFDPGITRGEDIDYLINARLAGQWFFMNKDLRIVHLPPKGGSYQDVAYHKVVQDVLRFVYERAKLAAGHQIGAIDTLTPEDLDPYPGLFLRPDLDRYAEPIIENIIESTSPEQRDALGLGSSATEFLENAESRAKTAVGEYRRYQDAWHELVAASRANPKLNAALRAQIET